MTRIKIGTKRKWSFPYPRCFDTRKETLEATGLEDKWAPRDSMDNLENTTRFNINGSVHRSMIQ
jgi:hypothetical protein